MTYANKRFGNTGPYAQLEKIAMTESEREEATYALNLGEEIANTITWIFNGLGQLFASAAPKPGFKHRMAA